MQLKSVLTFVIALTFTTAVWAQTKISGTLQCGSKPDPTYTIPVGDLPRHTFHIAKGKCTWSRPMEIVELATKDQEGTVFVETTGNRQLVRSAAVGTMANGDKYFLSTQGGLTFKEGEQKGSAGTWTFTGGTGRLKGLKGKGTYRWRPNPGGPATYETEGEYQLPK
ncbi:MAG: hypothetical protein ACKV22_24760 [Bryobacteraceae bacterium]